MKKSKFHSISLGQCFKVCKNATEINESDEILKNKYFVSIDKLKVRYINPLVNAEMNIRGL